jgi:hypothetical protein
MGPTDGLEVVARRGIPNLSQDLSPSRPARSLVTILTRLPRLPRRGLMPYANNPTQLIKPEISYRSSNETW